MKFSDLPTPCFVVDEALMVQNLKILQGVMKRTDCKILLAQKAFSLYKLYPLIGQYLNGTAASGLYEARLGCEEMGKENHVFSPAYREAEFEELTGICSHIVFNSFSQLERFGVLAKAAGCEIGLRLNPECSTQQGQAVYDPCAPHSRLGITKANFCPQLLGGVSGFHFHTLCEQNSDALLTTVAAIEEQFGEWLPQMKWLNLGGGHHITRPDYDICALERCIDRLQNQYDLQIYLEPGEAVALHAGFLVTTVIDTIKNGMDIAILDASAACHMPDVLEMPYRPPLQDAGLAQEKAYTYRLGGPTCLAGDIIGDYSFDQPLKVGDRLVFGDMAIYSMVKTNTFNGMPLPAIVLRDDKGDCRVLNRFNYMDFKGRLA
ncbi:MAG: carboxynorspermidine decarboxylase [Candidatus Fimivivens sp.]